MGLAVTPRLRFLQKYQKQQQLKADPTRGTPHSKPKRPTQTLPVGSESEGSGSESEEGIPRALPKEDSRFGFDVDDDLDDFLKVKAKVGNVDDCVDQERDNMVGVSYGISFA